VSIYLCKGYKNIVEKLMPNAQVVADRFHVMSQINQELYQAIKSEKYQAKKDYKAAKTQKKKNKLELRIAIL
jgi:transposase